MEFSQSWILMAVLTPTFWAMGCVLDSCLIGSKIYRAPSDGAIVSCLFCLAPVLFALMLSTSTTGKDFVDQGIPIAAIAAGFTYAIHLFFYFRTLYCLNDVSGAETFIALSVLFVPLFAWWLLDEVLPTHFYLAFIIAAVGVILQCLPLIQTVGLPLLANMLVTMVAVSISMVSQASALASHGFIVSTLYFNLTCLAVAIAIIICQKKARQRIIQLCRRFPAVLIATELLGILAVLFSHRATQQAPSVSLVALIECLLPLIIILISAFLITANRFVPLLSREHLSTLLMQLQGVRMKLGAFALLMTSLAILTLQ